MPGISCVYMHCQSKTNYTAKGIGIAMACMANMLGLRLPRTPHKGHCPLNPAGGLHSPQTPGAIGYPLSFKNYLLQQKKTRTLGVAKLVSMLQTNSAQMSGEIDSTPIPGSRPQSDEKIM